MEQNRDGLPLHASDTTRRLAGVEPNVPRREKNFAIEAHNFASSPRMVQLKIFER
jgi:hypothetical protein